MDIDFCGVHCEVCFPVVMVVIDSLTKNFLGNIYACILHKYRLFSYFLHFIHHHTKNNAKYTLLCKKYTGQTKKNVVY